jgi:lactocepin
VTLALGVHTDPTRDAWPDALSAGSLSATGDRLPLLLTRGDGLPFATQLALSNLGARTVYVLGGEAAIGTGVTGALQGLGYEVVRLAGPDRVATSVAVAVEALQRRGDEEAALILATKDKFPDGLAAGALAARLGGVIVLVPFDQLDATLEMFVAERASRFDRIVLVGGDAVISTSVEARARNAADGP